MSQSKFMIASGFFLVFCGVGGIESNGPLVDCTFIACLGLAIAWCGVKMLPKNS
jgi:hypothetical protein